MTRSINAITILSIFISSANLMATQQFNTAFESDGDASKPFVYLDRHHVACHSKGVLTQFKLNREYLTEEKQRYHHNGVYNYYTTDRFTVNTNKIRYDYRCVDALKNTVVERKLSCGSN